MLCRKKVIIHFLSTPNFDIAGQTNTHAKEVIELVREEEFDDLKTRVERLEKLMTPDGIGKLVEKYVRDYARRHGDLRG